MKKILILIFALILILTITACENDNDNAGANENRNDKSANGDDGLNKPNNNSSLDLDDFPEDEEVNKGWPTGTLYNIPDLKDIIEIHGYLGSFDESAGASRTIEVSVTDDSLEEWLDALRDAGYRVESGKSIYGTGMVHSAALGPVYIRVSESGYAFQIEFDFMKIGTWPSVDLPGFIVQIPGKTIIGTPEYYKPGDDIEGRGGILVDETGYNFQFIYTGLTAEEAVKYMEEIAAKLDDTYFSEGGTYLDYGNTLCILKGTYNWNSQNCHVYGEIMQADDSTFEFYFGWSQNKMGW